MDPPQRILVALSGGVDSSVAAARLVAAGHDVVGVTLHLWDYPDDGQVKGRCCAPEDVHDARRVCDALKIPYFAFDRRELFQREVVQPFVDAYLEGVTPSPCVRCNRGVKVRELLTLADRLGASHVATGHYARITEVAGRPALFRARDLSKDQSYFLHMLDAATLGRLMFPLGNATKAEIRAEAQRLALPGASKGESQELCFVPRGRYDALVSARAGDRVTRGELVDEQGRVLAEHDGIHRFTVGQRKNLGVAAGKRLYVVSVEQEGTVRLGPREQLLADTATLSEVALATGVEAPLACQAVVRYRGTPLPAKLKVTKSGAHQLEFDQPLHAIVPGQVAVLYDGDRVLGGGTIRKSSLRAPQNAASSVTVDA